jgi:formate dehydrogenase major subunit
MKEIMLTINGRQVEGREGDTVLEVCEANNIYVPTLCHLKGLTDVGACRICVVEVEKERRPVPACTYPAREGLVVQTHNDKLEKYRRLILELMFTERNHLCAQCVASGDCELQSLAYKYQMDNVRYSYSWPARPVDSVSDYIVIDHNRCILCSRCIRTCDELVGVHTLDFGYRGWKDTVVADLNQPLGTSSCISCGACFQVCPTGTIFSKNSAYKGRPQECQKVNSTCPICGVGCRIEALVKDNRLVRIDSPDLTGERGILCHKVRFAALHSKNKRIKAALVRNGRGRLKLLPLGKAIDIVAQKLFALKTQYGGNSIVGIASSQASNDSLKAFKELIGGVIGSELIDTFDGDAYRTIANGINAYEVNEGLDIETSLEEILKADCITVVGANSLETHPVAGSYIARAVRHNKAKLIVIDSSQNAFPYHVTMWLKPRKGKEQLVLDALVKAAMDKSTKRGSRKMKEIAAALKEINVEQNSKRAGIGSDKLLEAAAMLSTAKNSVVVYGEGILKHDNPELVTSLLNLAIVAGSQNRRKPQIISLKPKGNSRGAWDLGIANSSQSVTRSLTSNKIKGLYILLSDDQIDAPELSKLSNKVEFVVIQSAYSPPPKMRANVVLPSPSWAEVSAKYTSLDGLARRTSRLVKSPRGIKTDSQILHEISKRMRK